MQLPNPRWIAPAVAFGGGLMSTFSGVLPESVQMLGFYSGLVLAAVGIAVSVAYWILNLDRRPHHPLINRRAAAPSLQDETGARLTPNLPIKLLMQLEDTGMPRISPAGGKMNMASLAPILPEHNPGNFHIHTTEPNVALNWGHAFFPAYRFEIINYGPDPLISVEVSLRVVFQKVIREGVGMRGGDVVLDRPWRLVISRLDVGVAEKFEAYLYCGDPDAIATIMLPDHAEGRRVGEADAETFRLDVSSTGPFFLFPAHD